MGKNNSGKRKKKSEKKDGNTTPSSKRQRASKTPSPTKAPDAAPESVGSDVKFMTNEQLEKCSKQANRYQKQQKPTEREVRERQARNFIDKHSTTMKLEIRNGMFPFVSDVSLSKDGGKIKCYRNQINHNTICSKLSNEMTNNFLGNPIGADLTGKVHEKAMGTDMLCLLTYNTNVSSDAMAKFLHIEERRICPTNFYDL